MTAANIVWETGDLRIYVAVTGQHIDIDDDAHPVEHVFLHYRYGTRKTWYLRSARLHGFGPTAEQLAGFDQDDIEFRAAYPDMPHAIPGWLVDLVAAHVPAPPVDQRGLTH